MEKCVTARGQLVEKGWLCSKSPLAFSNSAKPHQMPAGIISIKSISSLGRDMIKEEHAASFFKPCYAMEATYAHEALGRILLCGCIILT